MHERLFSPFDHTCTIDKWTFAKHVVLACSAFFGIWFSAASPHAYAQPLEGIWVAILDINGAVFPHIEELRIGRDSTIVTTIYGIRRIPACDGDSKLLLHLIQGGQCALGQTNVTGRLAVNNAKSLIAIDAPTFSVNAMRGIGVAFDERVAHDLFWFGPGEPWTFRHEAKALVMSRLSRPTIPNTELDGSRTVVVEKLFYPVDVDFARDLIAFAKGTNHWLSILKLACVMPFITGEDAPAREFRTLMRGGAAIARNYEELWASAITSRSDGAVAMLEHVESTLSVRFETS